MKRLITLLVLAAIAGSSHRVSSQTNLIGPPLGLEWGTSYSEAKALLKSKGIEIENLKEEKKLKLPKGFKVAKVGKYEVLDRKTFDNRACFNADGGLCAFQINFRFFEGDVMKTRNKALEFLKGELEKAIVGKYSGEGYKAHKDPDQDGNVPELAFRDEVGNEVAIYFQTRKELLGEASYVLVYYSNEEILKATRVQQKTTDKL